MTGQRRKAEYFVFPVFTLFWQFFTIFHIFLLQFIKAAHDSAKQLEEELHFMFQSKPTENSTKHGPDCNGRLQLFTDLNLALLSVGTEH